VPGTSRSAKKARLEKTVMNYKKGLSKMVKRAKICKVRGNIKKGLSKMAWHVRQKTRCKDKEGLWKKIPKKE